MDGPPPSWELALDPAGDEGVVRLRQDGADRLFLVQPGVIPHELSPRDSGLLGYVAGYARTADHHRFLLTSDAERSLTLWRLEEDALVFVWRQSTPSGSLSAALVRDRAGRRLALWLREAPGAHYGSPWYFYPLDERGRAQAPELVGATVFDAALRPCTEDAEGWWLVGPPPGIPTAALSDDEAASVTLDEVEMLLKPDAGCLLGAHAPAAGIPVNTTRASLKPGIPLRVSEMVSERLWTCHAP